MKALLIDDEPSNIENLQLLLKQYTPAVEVCACAGKVSDGIAAINKYKPQLVFLDIQLHRQSGFDLLKQLESINFEIIFVTAYNQYAIQAIKFSALDYLLKPIDPDELKAAVDKAAKAINLKQNNERLAHMLGYLKDGGKKPGRIALPLFGETRFIDIDDIVRCMAESSYTRFVLRGGEQVLVSKTLKEYADLLTGHGFLRAHQSHLVNLAFIKSLLKEDGGTLLLTDNTKIPVSKLNRDKVKERLMAGF
ncbi:LytTR family two component transcriptional regulator [Mucilaginibacter oryzae]|uniref:LytTR family two component transcriptional regulator n=1 Tax=Mucilaginibacter oryzae TaxID=468058 RepID=A0A316H2R6_9SPHI|nr:LytTR family DNA-binding domain-containing protein [Mucilaginibacter oryzae]PWK72960.1 LytTR family two component transcriptional regulator [Mucilaginibacter oryzae]